MSKPKQRHIEVYADWVGLPQPTPIGVLHAVPSRGKELFSFEYHHDWLSNPLAFSIDPSLELYTGHHYAPERQHNFGAFLDSSPDRWGRILMNRREAMMARQESRKERNLLESDYLLGVYDEHRMGALRFKVDPRGPFLDSDKETAAPPWVDLRNLEHASLEIEKDNAEENPNYSKWLQMLIAPGGSLGGARPKADVVDESGHPWIAKFPKASDHYDVGAWEMVVARLATNAKIEMSKTKLEQFNSHHHTFLSKRFDRTACRGRIHIASAMTLLQHVDGDDADNGASYIELADFIKRQGARRALDLEQLWRRIVFSICVSNVDDHLRNHSFILDRDGWLLSPAYDINPVPKGFGLKLNISETDNSQDLNLARDVAKYFGIDKGKVADEIIQEVMVAVKGWPSIAKSLGITAKEQNEMAPAFRVAESE